jgi:hypothetical protein
MERQSLIDEHSDTIFQQVFERPLLVVCEPPNARLRDLAVVSLNAQVLAAAARYFCHLGMAYHGAIVLRERAVALRLADEQERELSDLLSTTVDPSTSATDCIVGNSCLEPIIKRHQSQLMLHTTTFATEREKHALDFRDSFASFLRTAAGDMGGGRSTSQQPERVTPLVDHLRPCDVAQCKVRNVLDVGASAPRDPTTAPVVLDCSPLNALPRCLSLFGHAAAATTEEGEQEAAARIELHFRRLCVSRRGGVLVVVGSWDEFTRVVSSARMECIDPVCSDAPWVQQGQCCVFGCGNMFGASTVVYVSSSMATGEIEGHLQRVLGACLTTWHADMLSVAVAASSSCVDVLRSLCAAIAQVQRRSSLVRLPNCVFAPIVAAGSPATRPVSYNLAMSVRVFLPGDTLDTAVARLVDAVGGDVMHVRRV